MGKKSTYGLTPEQLGKLLSLGIDESNFADKISDDKAIAGILRNWLLRSLPQDSSLLDSLLVIMGKMGCGMESLAGKSIGKVLLDRQTDIGLLQAIKTYSKKLSFTVDSDAEEAIAVTMYHAAIANSLLYHDKKISQSSYETLEQSFTKLIKKEWLTPELKELFSKACRICQERRGAE
ncbi:MAG: hypothetical protein ACYS9T_00490 [Planctomycetota bacterium]|jgi:hypothetical protein